MSTPSGNGACEGDGVVVEVVGDDGTLGGEDETGGFGGGEVFEEVGDGFVVVDLFETGKRIGEVVGFGGWVGEDVDVEGEGADAHGAGFAPGDGVVEEDGGRGELEGFGGFGLTVVEVDEFGGTEVELTEYLKGFGGFEKGLDGLI